MAKPGGMLMMIWLAMAVAVLGVMLLQVGAEPEADKAALLDFVSRMAVGRKRRLNWSPNTTVCGNWVGVVCDTKAERVIGLRLPGIGLWGPIPNNTLGRLTALQVLSLRANVITDSLPPDFASLRQLQLLNLHRNRLSGPLPSAILQAWADNLVVLDLSWNGLSGLLPPALAGLTKLSTLYLQNNSFSGNLSALARAPATLRILSVANNSLSGGIPAALVKFGAAAFEGNPGLCGQPLMKTCSGAPVPTIPSSPAPSMPPSSPESPTSGGRSNRNNKRSLSIGAIAAIAVGGTTLAFLILVVLVLCLAKHHAEAPGPIPASEKALRDDKEKGIAGKEAEMYGRGSVQEEAERNKLVFFEGCGYAFDLEDLLRASAEVLGKGSVGTTYKAVLEDGTSVVVKRLKEVAASKKDFEQHMNSIARIRHSNVLALRAFYFSKDEKLLVYDYLPRGSLSALLHGGRGGSTRVAVDWDTRVRIALGAARGLAQIHSEGGGKLAHGNIRSSNILLSADGDGVLCDVGVAPLTMTSASGSAPGAAARVAGYRAPEVVESRKVTQRSDVYSFGVLLLELLTGKAPAPAAAAAAAATVGGKDEVVDLPRWVQSVVREEWTAEVFDVELMRFNNIEEDMVQLLQIAMACVARAPDQRPRMADVVRMIDDLNRPTDSSDDRSRDSAAAKTPSQPRTPPSRTTP